MLPQPSFRCNGGLLITTSSCYQQPAPAKVWGLIPSYVEKKERNWPRWYRHLVVVHVENPVTFKVGLRARRRENKSKRGYSSAGISIKAIDAATLPLPGPGPRAGPLHTNTRWWGSEIS
jgi:hypothetical protein